MLMLNFRHKNLVQVTVASFESVLFTKNSCFISSLSRAFFSTSTASDTDSFVVSYLIESCGLSRDSALQASKHIKIANPDKANRVLAFFRSHGFSDAQISKVVKGLPQVLRLTPEGCLSPKFEFFYSKGISETELVRMASAAPRILSRSLKDYYIPVFSFYEKLFKSEKKAAATFKRFLMLRSSYSEAEVPLAMDVLRSYGVPESNIAKLLQSHPGSLSRKADSVKKIVEELKTMGLEPRKLEFIMGFRIMNCLSKATWERKVSLFGKWGWSKKAVITAFCKFPNCIAASEEKINALMDHFVNKLGCESSVVAELPTVFSYNLEKRVIPRTLLLKFLKEKGVLNKNCSWLTPLQFPEERFLQKYVFVYENEAPKLLKLYKDLLNASAQQDL